MYRKIEDFITDWKAESENTLKIFSAIGDQYISTKVSDNVRGLGRLAWHITQTVTEMPAKAGLFEKDALENIDIPASFAEIMNNYKKYSAELANLVEEKWTDEMLAETVNMYGQDWQRHKILSALINHEIHHRGQMTIVMRLHDIKVPGIYGPSKEEWAQFGMEAQE